VVEDVFVWTASWRMYGSNMDLISFASNNDSRIDSALIIGIIITDSIRLHWYIIHDHKKFRYSHVVLRASRLDFGRAFTSFIFVFLHLGASSFHILCRPP